MVVEQGLASTSLAKSRLSDSFALKLGLDDITCRRGCSHCCYYPVTISIWEGVSLYRALKREGIWKRQFKASLEHHARLTFGTAPETWLMAGIPCPLLVDGMCSAYASRPFRCRVTTSTKDPDRCRSVYFGPETFESNQMESAEFAGVERRASRASRDHCRGLDARVPLSVAVLVGYQIVEEVIQLDEVTLTLLRMLGQSA